MYDFHLHLTRLPHSKEVASLLKQAGTSYNNIACEPWEWEKSIEMGETRAFGIHPMIATKVSEGDWERLTEILKQHPNAQVGECGLDKRFDGYEPGGVQEQVFRRQALLAKELGRTLHIHCVGDYLRVVEILEAVGFGGGNTAAGTATGTAIETAASSATQIVFHRFGGDISAVKAIRKAFGDCAIFSLHIDSFRKKSTDAAIKEIPQTRVRFETDADESFVNPPAGTSAVSANPSAETKSTDSIAASTIANQIQNRLMQVMALYNSTI